MKRIENNYMKSCESLNYWYAERKIIIYALRVKGSWKLMKKVLTAINQKSQKDRPLAYIVCMT